jgi:hypothetical protein
MLENIMIYSIYLMGESIYLRDVYSVERIELVGEPNPVSLCVKEELIRVS